MSRVRQSVTFCHRVERALRENDFDLIHAISPCRVADLYQPRGGTVAETIERNLALIRSPSARRLKRYANRLNFKQRYMLALERAIFTNPNGPAVVAISDYVARQLEHHYQMPPARIHQVYNGVDPDSSNSAERERQRHDIRAEYGIAQDACLAILIAHNFRLKGVEQWMEALAELIHRRHTKIRSLVIGKGESTRWHRLAARLGIAEYLTFTGPTDRIAAFRQAADILVHPTFYDPCSRVVLEGMTAGLPCITTRWDGASEMIESGVNGFVLDDPRDRDRLVEWIVRLGDADLRRRIGTAASSLAVKISQVRHVDSMLSLYETLLVRKGSPG